MSKVKKRENVRYHSEIMAILIAMSFLYGGYYPFVYVLSLAAAVTSLVIDIRGKTGIRLPTGLSAWCLYILCICHCVSVFFAINTGTALLGFLRTLFWVSFCILINGCSQREHEDMLKTTAWTGVGLSGLYSILFFVNQAIGYVDLNGRIDGPFQYANTWALYQLVCLIILAFYHERTKRIAIGIGILLFGIILTGSRTVLGLCAVLAVITLTVQIRKGISPVTFFQPALLALAALLPALFVSRELLLQRFLAIPSSSSLNGRLLYALDSFRMIIKHPMGVGMGGYYYLQTLEQTGVYTVRFIHNEYLQFALDAGIPAGIASLVFVMSLLLRKRMKTRNRAAVFIIAAHSFVDFDFQFSVIVCLLLLLASEGKEEKSKWISLTESKLGKRLASVAGGFLCLCCIYLSAVYFLDYTGRTAWTLFPADLEMAEKYLQNCSSAEEAEKTAQRIINHTDLSMVAWDCVCQAAEARGDTMRMVMAKYQYLRLNRYRAEAYEDFSAMIEAASENCTEDEIREYRRLALVVIQQMEEVREKTSSLAYRIVDRPELDFMEEITARLNHVVEKG